MTVVLDFRGRWRSRFVQPMQVVVLALAYPANRDLCLLSTRGNVWRKVAREGFSIGRPECSWWRWSVGRTGTDFDHEPHGPSRRCADLKLEHGYINARLCALFMSNDTLTDGTSEETKTYSRSWWQSLQARYRSRSLVRLRSSCLWWNIGGRSLTWPVENAQEWVVRTRERNEVSRFS